MISKKSHHVTDKMLLNFKWLGIIKIIIPNAKIIHCIRDPRDNCISIFKSHFPGGKVKFAYNFTETIHYYNLYSDLMKHWNNLFPEFIYNIEYEKLIKTNRIQRNVLLVGHLESCDQIAKNFRMNRDISIIKGLVPTNEVKIDRHSTTPVFSLKSDFKKIDKKINLEKTKKTIL